MKTKILLVLALITAFTIQNSFWYDKTELKLVYDKFYLKIERNVKDKQKIIANLESLDKKISGAISKIKSETKKQVLNDLLSMNKSKINALKITKIKENIEVNLVNNTPFVSELINAGYKNLILNDGYEYTQNGATYRFIYKKYYPVDSNNYQYFIKNKLQNGYIIRYEGAFLVTNDFEIEKKYAYDELFSLFKNKVDYKNSYTLEEGDYFTYKYNYYVFFEKTDGLYLTDLGANKIDTNKTLIAKNIDGKFFFSNDYKKIRLMNQKLITGVTNKDEFFYNVLDDNRNIEGNYDDVLLNLKLITQNITKDAKTQEEKIKIIYKRVVDNIEYYKNYSDGNKQVFSWVHTFKNKTGVCDGYTKIFSYMLSFAWVSDVEIKRGYAYDSNDFPNFWHAWVRIGNYYYDPTFDDPIGNTQSDKTVFTYYKLPHDLMYVNRFDGIDIPVEMKTLNLDARKKLVLKNMYELYDTYKDYLLMSKIKNRKALGVSYDENVDLNLLMKKVKFYEVNNFSYYDENGKKYSIAGLNYYLLENSKLDMILFDSKIDLNQSKFFKWYDQDGNLQYRLAYNLRYY